jgi:hypothetical protein
MKTASKLQLASRQPDDCLENVMGYTVFTRLGTDLRWARWLYLRDRRYCPRGHTKLV